VAVSRTPRAHSVRLFGFNVAHTRTGVGDLCGAGVRVRTCSAEQHCTDGRAASAAADDGVPVASEEYVLVGGWGAERGECTSAMHRLLAKHRTEPN